MKIENKKIKKIVYVGKKRVYDISVEKLHNFILSNGILSHNCCDCQSPSETRGIVSGSEDFTLMFRLTSFRDKRELCDELIKEKKMTNSQVADLSFLDKGQCYINETGSHAVKKVQIRLPRTMYWKREYGNFYKNVWERFGGEWKQTNEVIDEIALEVGDAKKKYIKINKQENIKNNNVNKSDNIKINKSILSSPTTITEDDIPNLVIGENIEDKENIVDNENKEEVNREESNGVKIKNKIKRSVL